MISLGSFPAISGIGEAEPPISKRRNVALPHMLGDMYG